MKKILIFPLISVIFSICFSPASGQTIAPKQKTSNRANLQFTDEDKFLIIKSLLEQNPQIKQQMSPESAKENLVINLSEKNLDVKLLPKFPQVKFVLLNANDIKNYKGLELSYKEFEKIEFNGYNVKVTFSMNNLARGFFPTKSSSTYEYYKINGKWVGRMISSYHAN